MTNLHALATSDARYASADDACKYTSGTLIADKYRLERSLGVGGMGAVWLARNELLGLPVALKLILPELRAQEMTDRLLTEARVGAKLQHSGFVRVFDFGETADGDPFIVMELLEGRNLAELLQDGRCSPIQAVQTILPVLDALGSAHAAGVVHRDLKPDNIFLAIDERGIRPKLLDFGIAILLDQDHDGVRSAAPDGSLVGSPAYMAPEQARGAPELDHRADIWSACVVLYEAISGAAPFGGASYPEVLCAVLQQEAQPLANNAQERALWPILARGLAKDPAQRFASMRELGNALAIWLAAQGVTEDLCGDPLTRTWDLQARVALAFDAQLPPQSARLALDAADAFVSSRQLAMAQPRSPRRARAAPRNLRSEAPTVRVDGLDGHDGREERQRRARARRVRRPVFAALALASVASVLTVGAQRLGEHARGIAESSSAYSAALQRRVSAVLRPVASAPNYVKPAAPADRPAGVEPTAAPGTTTDQRAHVTQRARRSRPDVATERSAAERAASAPVQLTAAPEVSSRSSRPAQVQSQPPAQEAPASVTTSTTGPLLTPTRTPAQTRSPAPSRTPAIPAAPMNIEPPAIAATPIDPWAAPSQGQASSAPEEPASERDAFYLEREALAVPAANPAPSEERRASSPPAQPVQAKAEDASEVAPEPRRPPSVKRKVARSAIDDLGLKDPY